MASIGQELKRERELRGISLEEIADSTKINLRFLRALENDHLDYIPGKFFIIGIIRTYAKYIGLEEDYALNKYYETLQQEEQARQTESAPEKRPILPAIKIKTLTKVAFLFLLITAIIVPAYFLLNKKEEPPLPVIAPQMLPVIQEKETPPVPQPEEKEVKGLSLVLSFQDLTWIEVYADGQLKLSENMKSGDEYSIFAEKELILHVGNAGGLSFTINKKPGKSLGSSGEVIRDIHITLDNFKNYLEGDSSARQS